MECGLKHRTTAEGQWGRASPSLKLWRTRELGVPTGASGRVENDKDSEY